MGNTRTGLLPQTDSPRLSRWQASVQSNWELSGRFFVKQYFYLEELLVDKLQLFRLGCLANSVSTMSWICHFKGHHSQCVWPKKTCGFSNKSSNFGKLASATVSLTGSQQQKTFLMRSVEIWTNVSFWCCLTKCVSSLKIQIFQMPSVRS